MQVFTGITQILLPEVEDMIHILKKYLVELENQYGKVSVFLQATTVIIYIKIKILDFIILIKYIDIS